ncbi:glycoside hydrolase superfamily [Scheffersomyces xylosifermentans]|uniref:glycoside hydrolase superfamily n=1 Tax=Scheffersomyces xylosifermentans TaxID=1304137 RepID=UPI00315D762A
MHWVRFCTSLIVASAVQCQLQKDAVTPENPRIVQKEVYYEAAEFGEFEGYQFPVSNAKFVNESGSESYPQSTKKLSTNEKVYGVSLGGWLVAEPWIMPSLFDDVFVMTGKQPVDEYTLATILGKNRTREYLENHWNTFYTEQDFKEIKSLGLNLVRIPIGYWAFGLLPNDPYVHGQEFYLDRAISWARLHGLRVMLDIHGMPGSQNGFDNSGQRIQTPEWLQFDYNMQLTYKVVDYVLTKYGSQSFNDVITDIEIVNEPFGPFIDVNKLVQFYKDTYASFNSKHLGTTLVFQDAFLGLGWWNWFPGNITLDHHLYEIFSHSELARSVDQHISSIESQGRILSKETHPSIVGEFSGALTDCTRYINGVGRGARYDGTYISDWEIGSCANHTNFQSWSNQKREETKKFLQAEFYTFEENSNGWIFWCYKTEDSIEWDFRRLAQLNMLPNPLTRIKKKTSIRDKTAKRSNLASKISAFKQESSISNNEEYHENPMLKLSKITKKEKQQQKSAGFSEKLMSKITFNTTSSISKSASRRRKRREKEQLKPKMDELLMNLPSVDGTSEISSKNVTTTLNKIQRNESNSGYVKSSKINLNQPNAAKASGLKKILKDENKNFTNVLKNPEFRQSPFSALKNAIQQNLQG